MLSMIKNSFASKRIKIFIITLITVQGLYVVFPLPDIWPFSNYSMFSKAAPATVASSFEFYGLTGDGKEVLIDSGEAFLPLDKVRLKKGINRILNRESLVRKQEKKLNSILKRLRFLPVDQAYLRENARRLLPYKKDGVVADKEKELRLLFDYLFFLYEHNREEEVHGGPPVVSMNLYLTTWDWTDAPPREVFPETRLIYSSEYGLSGDE